jgi:fumarylacetoacetase
MTLTKSWVPGANDPDCPFPLNNLPYGVFLDNDGDRQCGVAIGGHILNVSAMEADDLLDLPDILIFSAGVWNDFMELGSTVWTDFRTFLTNALAVGSPQQAALNPYLVARVGTEMAMPFAVAEFTDFYSSRNHATNVGTMFRGTENALPPNWLHVPIGYNGRASTVVVSGTDIRRPLGQRKPKGEDAPVFGPSRRLDIELEIGAIVGTPTQMGQPVTVTEADAMIFGFVLLNDWSARDIQAWEYQPLGPFQAKAFATSISPWIVTAAALEGFRTSTPKREKPLLPYLHEPGPMLYDIDLSVIMQPAGSQPQVISRTNYATMYFSAAQQLAHHAASGCAMTTGDLLGSGTISGPTKDAFGSLLELCWGGQEPLQVGDQTRTFIEDGDTLTLRGWAQGDGFRIGFGDCTGTILPARDFPG